MLKIMAQYIDKNALAIEIKKKLEDILACKKDVSTPEERITLADMISLGKEILSLLDTLEVKEVDLEKETEKWWKEHLHLNPKNKLWMDAHQSVVLAKYFFELGLKKQNENKL